MLREALFVMSHYVDTSSVNARAHVEHHGCVTAVAAHPVQTVCRTCHRRNTCVCGWLPSTSSSAAPASSLGGSDGQAKPAGPVMDGEPPRATSKRKPDGEHSEDLQHGDSKRMRSEGNKRKTMESDEESILRKAVKYLSARRQG